MHAVTLGSAEIDVEEMTRPDRQTHAVSQNDREHLLGDVAALQSLDASIIFQRLFWGALDQPSLPAMKRH